VKRQVEKTSITGTNMAFSFASIYNKQFYQQSFLITLIGFSLLNLPTVNLTKL
jgi:hypothetical protein